MADHININGSQLSGSFSVGSNSSVRNQVGSPDIVVVHAPPPAPPARTGWAVHLQVWMAVLGVVVGAVSLYKSFDGSVTPALAASTAGTAPHSIHKSH